MLRHSLVALFLCGFGMGSAQQKYENRIFAPNINTLQATLLDDELSDPILRLGSEDVIEISFDLMSKAPNDYSYSLIHCNADWTPSQLLEMEYMKGFNDNSIDEYEPSFNTTFDYTHYLVQIPNEKVAPLVSGNYVLKVYEKDAPERVALTAQFMVVEQSALEVSGRVASNTTRGVNTAYQLLNFSVNTERTNIANSADDIKLLIRQNGRLDNEVREVKPTYIKMNELLYEDNRQLEFEGGSEYERIDFSHIRNYSGNIERISFHHPYYNVEVFPGEKRRLDDYKYNKDVNGRYKVHGQDIWTDLEIDYSIVHFTYPREEPWLDGALYVCGYFNDNKLNGRNQMTYNFERKQYELDIVLKNGGYNYQFLFLPYGKKQATAMKSCGSYWQTENEYAIYVYYSPNGARYDRLLNVTKISSVTR